MIYPMKYILLISVFFLTSFFCRSQSDSGIKPAAERLDQYLPLLKGKKLGVFANPTSTVGGSHLVDTLLHSGVTISVIFGPEHGFRGTADAGEKVGNYVDKKTNIPVVSLYGSKTRPSAEDLKNVDLLLFDIQDVGVRFYTYISSLEALIESAIEFNKPLIILDRPNPNGFYVDGPVLNKKYQSFVGRQPIPVVYGMTIGEYAWMITREGWLNPAVTKKLYPEGKISSKKMDWENPSALTEGKFALRIITCQNYSHKSRYTLPVKPSPNLPDIRSIYLYPSTCFFEGTVFSEGRGTATPFQVFGHPSLPRTLYSFTPNPNEGAKSSKHFGQVCYGWNLSGTVAEVEKEVDGRLQLKWLMEAYRLFPGKDSFFIKPKSGRMEDCFFDKLAGNSDLRKQLEAGVSEEVIRKSWEPELSKFKLIRKRYLLYEDF